VLCVYCEVSKKDVTCLIFTRIFFFISHKHLFSSFTEYVSCIYFLLEYNFCERELRIRY